MDGRVGSGLVAVKRLHKHLATDRVFVSMLVDEARLASAIRHDNVVRVHELGFEAGAPYIVMDYVEGASLADLTFALLDAGRAFDVRMALRISLDTLAGLHAAHELRDETGRPLGIVHRDVSPQNLLIGCDGRTRLTDFGVAKAQDRVQVTQVDEVKGKLSYLAPERIDKRRICTAQSDVFSMAIVLWECIAGRRLFAGDSTVDTLAAVMARPIPSLRDLGAAIPLPVDDVIARALSRDLDTRFSTAADFASALERSGGPLLVGTHAEVGRLMEAFAGLRMAERHSQIRLAVAKDDVVELLRASGLPDRESLTGERLTPELLLSLAPPAPAGGTLEMVSFRPARRWRWIAGAGLGGLTLGAAVMAGVAYRRVGPIVPLVAAAPSFAAPAPSVVAEPVRSSRWVRVTLPVVAVRVTFDEVERELTPPSDTVSFELEPERGTRHRLTAQAADGTRAMATVVEADGIASLEGTVTRAAPVASPVRRIAVPAGTVKNGFTKLR